MPEQPEHERFVDFVAEFYRAGGRELPHFECDAQTAIAFEVLVDGVTFSVGYDPFAADGQHLFIHCVLGPVPPNEAERVLRRLLELNLSLARAHGAAYCFDAATGSAACYLRRGLSRVDVDSLREEMAGLAQQAQEWRAGHFLDDSRPGTAGDRVVSWAMFA